MNRTTVMLAAIAAIVLIALLSGCASPGSPTVTFSKDVHVNIHGNAKEGAEEGKGHSVTVTYTQTSATDLEAALEQVLDLRPILGLEGVSVSQGGAED